MIKLTAKCTCLHLCSFLLVISSCFNSSILVWGSIQQIEKQPEDNLEIPEIPEETTTTGPKNKKKTEKNKSSCPSYGCPLLPVDILTEEGYTSLITTMETNPNAQDATLTLTGSKGKPKDINQDRAFIVNPFFLALDDDVKGNDDDDHDDNDNDNDDATTGSSSSSDSAISENFLLMGVFDGHGNLGEVVSQYAVTSIPRLFSQKLYNRHLENQNKENKNDDESPKNNLLSHEQIKNTFHESFLEIDATVPTYGVGGCTASVLFQYYSTMYFANAGDSLSFLVLYDPQFDIIHIPYTTREDKPSIPEERERVEKMGGYVYIPPPERHSSSSRVVYIDPKTGGQMGIAMSRSLGDWEAGNVGVIPDPIVDDVDLYEILEDFEKIVAAKVTENETKEEECVVTDDGVTTVGECTANIPPSNDDELREYNQESSVIMFAVSATDGMMDYVSQQRISDVLASVFNKQQDTHNDGGTVSEDFIENHLLLACEQLVVEAANGWHDGRQGRYRDDIAISVSKVELPP